LNIDNCYTLGRDLAGNLLGESFSGGTLSGLSVNSGYDGFLRRNTLNFKNGSTTLASTTYGYDNASRMSSVTDGTHSAAYGYLVNSSLIGTTTFRTSGSTRLTTTRQYDFLERLQSIGSVPSGGSQLAPSFMYQYNAANQRIRVSREDGSSWGYGYDGLGQVTSGKRVWPDNTPVPGQQFEYQFDDIGNRTGSGTKVGGNATGGGLRSITYTPNALNQYASRSFPNPWGVDILGVAPVGTAVTVNSSPADYRRGEYFQEVVSVDNSSAKWQSISTVAGASTVNGNVFVPQTPEVFQYDLDGNLKQDGRWMFTWDGENRLTAMESLTTAPSGSKRRLTFEYDAGSRRIAKKVFVWNGSAYPASPNTSLKFLNDGFNLIGELDGANAVVRSYQWGLDLSGSLRGAGGVGGLVSVKPAGSAGQFPGYDGNGNVASLTDGTSGALSAGYEYGPFGEVVQISGAQALNPVRFSSRYSDTESGNSSAKWATTIIRVLQRQLEMPTRDSPDRVPEKGNAAPGGGA